MANYVQIHATNSATNWTEVVVACKLHVHKEKDLETGCDTHCPVQHTNCYTQTVTSTVLCNTQIAAHKLSYALSCATQKLLHTVCHTHCPVQHANSCTQAVTRTVLCNTQTAAHSLSHALSCATHKQLHTVCHTQCPVHTLFPTSPSILTSPYLQLLFQHSQH
jgi:hypothetical protein